MTDEVAVPNVKKTPAKGTQERRDYDRAKKALSRKKEKDRKQAEFHKAVQAEVDAVIYSQIEEPEIPKDQKALFEANSNAVRAQIESEVSRGLNDYGHPKEWETVCGLAQTSFGLDNPKLIILSFSPYGVRCNYWFPDAAVHNAIEFIRRDPRSPLLFSRTFMALYKKALVQVRDYYGIQKNHGAADPGCLADIQREAGV